MAPTVSPRNRLRLSRHQILPEAAMPALAATHIVISGTLVIPS